MLIQKLEGKEAARLVRTEIVVFLYTWFSISLKADNGERDSLLIRR